MSRAGVLAKLVLAAAVAAPLAAAAAPQPLRPWSGTQTPVLALRDLDGKPVDLARLKGRVVLVNFWATWCEPCIAEMPSIARLRSELAGKPFDVVAVNYGESAAKVRAYLAKAGIALPVALDPDKDTAERWNAKGLPMTFLVDARGQVRYWVFGERDWTDAESRDVVAQLLREARGAGR